MSYRDSSNQSGDLSEASVMLDLIRKGWVVLMPSSRDSVYDYVVDRGNGKFETVQVKTMGGNSISKVVDRSGEIVSANGKTRNSIDYAKHGIDWLAGVKKTGEIFYYKHSTYSIIKTKSFSVNLHKQDGFPLRTVPNRHARKKKISA
tara:strand:+ start:1991 stop:2431 length:441 start_codon:yes stop_codon:yes gene_type:complete